MICAVQDDAAMLSALNGSHSAHNSLIARFSQQIILSVKDPTTIKRVCQWFDKGEQVKHSSSANTSDSRSGGSSTSYSHSPQGGGGGNNDGWSRSTAFTENVSTATEDIFTNQEFAKMKVQLTADGSRPEFFQAVFSGYIGGEQKDDVINLFVDDETYDVSIM